MTPQLEALPNEGVCVVVGSLAQRVRFERQLLERQHAFDRVLRIHHDYPAGAATHGPESHQLRPKTAFSAIWSGEDEVTERDATEATQAARACETVRAALLPWLPIRPLVSLVQDYLRAGRRLAVLHEHAPVEYAHGALLPMLLPTLALQQPALAHEAARDDGEHRTLHVLLADARTGGGVPAQMARLTQLPEIDWVVHWNDAAPQAPARVLCRGAPGWWRPAPPPAPPPFLSSS